MSVVMGLGLMMTRIRRMVPALVLSTGLLACQTSGQQAGSSASPSKAAPRPERTKSMPTSTYLPAKAREKIRETMKAHGDDMTVLMWSIIFLDVDGAAEFARVIQDQKWLERPADPAAVPEDERVPEPIYAFQDDIVARAKALAATADNAEKHQAAGLADAFAGVARTCVACHAAYLYDSSAAATAADADAAAATE